MKDQYVLVHRGRTPQELVGRVDEHDSESRASHLQWLYQPLLGHLSTHCVALRAAVVVGVHVLAHDVPQQPQSGQ